MNEVDLCCDVLRARLLSQEGLIRDYGTKAGVLLGIGSAMIGAGAVILSFSVADFVGPGGAIFLLMVLAFVFNAVLGIIVITPKIGEPRQGWVRYALILVFGRKASSICW